MQELYNEMWYSFQRGEITQEEWLNFGNAVLDQLITEIEESLIRLKNI